MSRNFSGFSGAPVNRGNSSSPSGNTATPSPRGGIELLPRLDGNDGSLALGAVLAFPIGEVGPHLASSLFSGKSSDSSVAPLELTTPAVVLPPN
jgi:hypothetical protein